MCHTIPFFRLMFADVVDESIVLPIIVADYYCFIFIILLFRIHSIPSTWQCDHSRESSKLGTLARTAFSSRERMGERLELHLVSSHCNLNVAM